MCQVFLLLTIIVFCLNVILIFKNKNLLTFILLLVSAIIELITIYNIIKDNQVILYHLHNIYFVLLMLGSILLDNIYLSFIILLIFLALITREYYKVCLFLMYKQKTDNGSLTITVLFIIILLRIFFQKQFKNLLKF